MKIGISLMSVFTLVIFAASWLNISPLLFILPVLWFYSFFDCMNRRYSSDEEFAALEDSYLFSIDRLVASGDQIFKKRRLMAGVLLLLLGVYLIWNNLLGSIIVHEFLTQTMYIALRSFTNIAPQIILGVAVVVIGIKLIAGKKRESGFDA